MKNFFQQKIICILYLLSTPTILAGQEIVNVFQVGGDICEPVTLKTSKGTYTIRGSITINGNLSWFEAYDCRGNQIVNPSGSVSTRSGQTVPMYLKPYITTTIPTHTETRTTMNDKKKRQAQ